jgi:nicotinamidase-related amidase
MIRIYTPDAADADRCRRAALLAGRPLLLKGSQGRRPVDALLPDPMPSIDDDTLLKGEAQFIGPDEAILFKPRWGAFYRTPLEAHLKARGVSTLVIAGCNFPNCTRATLYQASERDYRVTAVVDAISGLTPPDVACLESIGINCLTTAQLIALMEGNVSEALTQTGVHAP